MTQLHFRKQEMRVVFSANFDDFASWAKTHDQQVLQENNRKQHHIYIDRGSDVLAVAHLDSVQHYNELFFNRKARQFFCSTIDNRLGVWLALFGLPRLGIDCDVLLTDHEENGGSTAEYFTSPKQYNWSFSFDRTGEDVVMYHHHSNAHASMLENYDFTVGHGSYSDISVLDIGAAGFNIGCGMHRYHTNYAYCNIAQLKRNVYRFANFYRDMKDTHMQPGEDVYGYGGWDDDFDLRKYFPKYDADTNGNKWMWKEDDTYTAGGHIVPYDDDGRECGCCGNKTWGKLYYSPSFDTLLCEWCHSEMKDEVLDMELVG